MRPCAAESRAAAARCAGGGPHRSVLHGLVPSSFHLPPVSPGSRQPCTAFFPLFPRPDTFSVTFLGDEWFFGGAWAGETLNIGRWQLCPRSQAKPERLFSLDECCRQRGRMGRDTKPPGRGAEQGETRERISGEAKLGSVERRRQSSKRDLWFTIPLMNPDWPDYPACCSALHKPGCAEGAEPRHSPTEHGRARDSVPMGESGDAPCKVPAASSALGAHTTPDPTLPAAFSEEGPCLAYAAFAREGVREELLWPVHC